VGTPFAVIWCLLVQSWDHENGDERVEFGVALTLASMEQDGSSRYIRIGYFEVRHEWFNDIGDSYLTIV
jgi:hypothetical protein